MNCLSRRLATATATATMLRLAHRLPRVPMAMLAPDDDGECVNLVLVCLSLVDMKHCM